MNGQFIVVSSITYAYKGKSVLEKRGYKAFIEREPLRLSSCGCHYIIRVKDISLAKAVELLKENHVKVLSTGNDDSGLS